MNKYLILLGIILKEEEEKKNWMLCDIFYFNFKITLIKDELHVKKEKKCCLRGFESKILYHIIFTQPLRSGRL